MYFSGWKIESIFHVSFFNWLVQIPSDKHCESTVFSSDQNMAFICRLYITMQHTHPTVIQRSSGCMFRWFKFYLVDIIFKRTKNVIKCKINKNLESKLHGIKLKSLFLLFKLQKRTYFSGWEIESIFHVSFFNWLWQIASDKHCERTVFSSNQNVAFIYWLSKRSQNPL